MLSSIFLKRPKIFNQELHNYCLKSTNESIRKLVEKNEKERKFKFDDKLFIASDNSNPNPNNNIITFLCFLSVSSILLYFYNSKR
jgi:hypothetical protein